MKKEISLLLFLLVTTFCAFSQSALSVADTRDVVTSPTSYIRSFQVHFKRNTSIGLPFTAYSTILGLRGWQDDSGGKAHELAFTNTDLYLRSGLNNGWEAWRKILAENVDGNVGIGINVPNSKLHVQHTEPGWNMSSTTNAFQVGQINGIRLHTGYVGELNKWAGIASVVEDLHSNKTGLALYTGYVERFRISDGGNVGIGTTNPTEKLAVNGTIRAKEIKVDSSPWPDYVFEDNYKIKPLTEIEAFIKANKHLPGMPNQKQVGEEGVSLGEMNRMLLEKVEELTLILIQKDKIQTLQSEKISDQEERIKVLEKASNIKN